MSHAKTSCTAVILFLASQAATAIDCTEASRLTGTFGLKLDGRTVNTNQPYIAVGLAKLGRGNFTLDLTRSEAGIITRETLAGNIKGTGCNIELEGTGSSAGFKLAGQTSGRAQPILLTEIRSTSPVVASGPMQPVGIKTCSNLSLKGNYIYLSQGYERSVKPDNSWLAIGKTGRESFDGKGCSVYTETVKTGATVTTIGPELLPYSVNTDCSFDLTKAGQRVVYGILLNGGSNMVYMTLVDGAVRGGEYSRASGSPKLPGCGTK